MTIQEALYAGGTTGVARTNEAVTLGVPLPDSAGITSTNVFGLTGATAAQFSIEGKWPSGNIKWLKIRAIVPSVAAGGTATVTLTSTGTGDFGGADLAVDNGSDIIVSTGASVFNIRKAKFNVVDKVVTNGATVVASGSSGGVVVLGPDPTAPYPGNVTCLPTAGGTACTTVYSSVNDAASTCMIEENGPAMAVVKCDGDLEDTAGHVYMHYRVREYFYQGKSNTKITTSLRNADYGASNTFATATKGYQGFELRVKANLSGTLNYSIGTHTAAPSTGTVSTAGGSDSVYIYQAESSIMKANGWCASTGCVTPSPLTGYAIVKNGAAVSTGSASQGPQGWADISDSSGVGIEIGQHLFAGYGNKSLEFRGGGTDVRIGVYAAENNTTSTSSTAANKPYYITWPQYRIDDVYLNFHAAPPASLSNDFLKLQHYLVARAPVSHYNASGALFYPLLDVAEENAYYASLVSTATPSISAPVLQDLGTADPANWLMNVYKFYTWPAPGITNQMEHRYSHLLNFIRRGLTGNYLDTANFYKMVSEASFPRSDGFDWKDKPSGEKRYFDEPTATSVNAALAMNNRIDGEHAHWYGMPDFYMMSGDETIKEAIVDGPRDYYLDSNSTNNLISMGKIWDARFVGAVLMGIARTSVFLDSIGDTAAASTLLSRGNTVWTLQIKPDLCASGYPAGCTPSLDGTDTGAFQRGTSKVRGVTFQWGDTSIDYTNCSFTIDRSHVPFENGILVQGMSELRQAYGPSWADYTAIYDVMYGITQGNFGEMFSDDGSNSWSGKGFRYKAAIDYPSSCSPNFRVQNPNAFWPMFTLRANYEGAATAAVWKRKLGLTLQGVISGGSAIRDELYQYTIANAIYAVNHPPLALTTAPVTGFTDNGGGSYTISWAVPAGAQSYRIKWDRKQIVEYIGYDAGTATFIGNPATTMNWFAATDAPNVPSPSGTNQSLTISTGVTGLTAANFMVKAYVNGGGGSGGGSIDVTPPSVGVTGPAAGATVSQVITLAAAASDNVAVTSLQFKVDGANLGSPIAGTGPYTMQWDTTKVSNGTHVITAAAFDAAGNGAISSPVSVSVNNSTGGTPGAGTLSGALTTPNATIQLTASGTADWAHWGLNAAGDFNHKTGVTQQISNYTVVGTGTPTRYGNNSIGYTWTDGTPAATTSATTTGLWISGLNNGFSLTVPADTSQRTLVLYLGAWRTTGRLVAHLSDGSSPDYVDTSLTNSSGSTTVGAYTLTYKAASSGETLTLTYTMSTSSGGNITLQAATLVAGAPVPDFTVSAAPAAPSLAASGSTTPSVSIAVSNGFNGAVALTASGQPNGIAVAFNPSTVTGGGSSAMNITASAGVAAGTYPVTVTATSGSLVRTTTVNLTVTGAVTAAPVISGVGMAAISASDATIAWTTDTPADSQVSYGPTTSYGSTTTLLPNMVTSHSVSLTGLSASTTYHYKVMSRNSSGLLSTSSDLTFATSAAGGSGTPVTTNTWTPIVAKGVPAQVLGYDKSVYVSSRKIHCIWGAYHEPISSEPNNATVCYSYPENRWFVLENNGMWHSDHAPSAGHTSSLFAYMPDRDTIVSVTDGSGSNVPEKFLAHWWWFDVAGLSGQDKEFTPKTWLGAMTPTSAMTYDTSNSKLVIFPNLNGTVSVCDPGSNSCTIPSTSGTAPPSTLGDLSLVYNSADRKVYLFGGGQNDLYTFNVATNAWAKLATTCTGTACVSGKPPSRTAAGFAYSNIDNVFLMAGGSTSLSGQAYYDTWIFDPVALAWKQQSPPTPYANNSNNTTFDRLSYDADSNVFLLMASGGANTYADGHYGAYTVQVWAYAYTAAANYGRSTTTFNPPAGSMNRVSPASVTQSWAMDPAIAASGSMAYAGWIETGAPFDSSSCGLHHPYIQSGSSITAWTSLPGGSQAAACAAIDPEPSTSPSYTDASKLRLAVVNGTLWEAHEKWNNSTTPSSAWAKSWNGAAWVGGAVGCFTAACSTNLPQNPQALIADGATPTIAVIEENHNVFVPEGNLYVAQWNGSKWTALGGRLNVGGTGTRALFATLASNGSNPAACWSEEVSSSRSAVTITPQIQCAQWNGSAWARFGTASLNRAASSWAYSPSMTYLGGKYYIGWVERTTPGPNKLYVCRWDGSTCTLLGGAAQNMNTSTGWAAHPSLANDGTNLYVAWEEQAGTGAKSIGYVKQWDGSGWSQVGGALNADPILGSMAGISLAVVQGAPTAIWTELTYGNLRQVYAKQWNGSSWIGTTGSSNPSPSPLSCDLNGDGKVDNADIDLATNQALGVLPCSTADLQGIGQCTVVGVQRIINASKGAVCRIGN